MAPPSTAAVIEANFRRGMLNEYNDPEVNRQKTTASIHKASIPANAPQTVQIRDVQSTDFLGIKT
jgi:hypothetical protein